MKISISGQHIEMGESLQQYVNERLENVVLKYFEKAINATVSFSRQGYLFVCDILVNEGTGRKVVIKGKASSDEIYSCFDMSLLRIERQLRRYKSKLASKAHRMNMNDSIEAIAATKYVLASDSEISEDAPEQNASAIIAEKPIEILTLSVSEAVMKMDLENLPALLFRNVKNNRINAVYYRKDGNISWVDTSDKAA